MATPTPGSVSVAASTATVYGGRLAPIIGGTVPNYLSTESLGADQYVPQAAPHVGVLYLHESGGTMPAFGAKYRGYFPSTGTYPENLSYLTHTYHQWSVQGYPGQNLTLIKPWDRQPDYPSGSRRESFWMGWTDGPVGSKTLWLYTERHLDMLLKWVAQNYPQISTSKLCVTGGSMGGWGSISYGIRRPAKFAALYPDRPRLRHSSAGAGNCAMPDWNSPQVTYSTSASPARAAADGGGTSAAHLDAISYVANTANAIPWIGWCVGRLDGYMPFQDHVDMVAAMRSAGRGFAFVWNNGTHSTGSLINQITSSYYYGLFEIGVGYPIYTNNSGDQDPAVDLEGGINLGFQHRNVVESSGAWSCEIRNLLGARTVTVKPKSSIYTGSGTPKVVNVPAGQAWVGVSWP